MKPSPGHKLATVAHLLSRSKTSGVDLAQAVWALQQADDQSEYQELIASQLIKPRKLAYLIKIGKALSEVPASVEAAKAIGWTKLSIIAEGLKLSNVDARIKIASQTTSADLAKAIKGALSDEPQRCMLIRLSKSDHSKLVSALTARGATVRGRGLVNAEAALMKLVAEVT
jgi:hypothetical protein